MASKVTIKYGNTTISEFTDSKIVTLKTNGKLMSNDIVVTLNNGRLPIKFNEVEYIGSDGVPYIDTGYLFNAETDNITFEAKRNTTSGCGMACGYGNTSSYISGNNFWFYTYYNGSDVFYIGNGSTGDFSTFSTSLDMNWHKYSWLNKVVYYDDVKRHTITISCTKSENTMILFATRSASGGVNTNFNGYIKYAHMWSGDTQVRSYIPCYCNTSVIAYKGSTATTAAAGTIGMYDLISDRFYINSGSGTFTKGPDVN